MRALVIGDPHIRVEDLIEGANLLKLIIETVREQKPDVVVFMGDLFHNFDLVHVEVASFWREALLQIKLAAGPAKIRILRGNHDGPHDPQPGVHALMYLENMLGIEVVDQPKVFEDKGTMLLFIPFMRDNAEFVKLCREAEVGISGAARTIYCHQEFLGADYDNGQLARGGVNPDDIPQTTIISGHIHTGQEFGKVWYVGAPRWMTASDANKDRFLWLIEHDPATGAVVKRTPIATDPWCQRLVQITDTEAKPEDPLKMKPEWKVIVTIMGSDAWIEQRKLMWAGKARIRTVRVTDKQAAVRESLGIDTALEVYFKSYDPKFIPSTTREELWSMTMARLAASAGI